MAKKIREEFKVVSLETAKLAKELGFDIATQKCYFDGELIKCKKSFMDLELSEDEYFAPAQVTLESWLRDKGYHIRIQPTYWGEFNEKTGKYEGMVIEFKTTMFDLNDIEHEGTEDNKFEDVGYKLHWIMEEDEDGEEDDRLFKTHAECLEASLQEIMKLIKKKDGI
jgi:hypothetical protein